MWNYKYIHKWDEEIYISEKKLLPERESRVVYKRALSAPSSSAIPFLYFESKAFVIYDL